MDRYPWHKPPIASATPPVGPASTVVSETSFNQAAIVGTDKRYAREGHSHGTPTAATSGTFQWLPRATITTAQDNPTALSWSFALKCWTHVPVAIHGYGYGLLTTGTKQMGMLRCSLFTNSIINDADWPTAEYKAARVMCFHDGLAAGPILTPLQSLGVTLVTIAAGYFWIVGNIQYNPSHGEVKPDIEWLDGGACGKAFSHALPSGTWGAFVTMPWDYANDAPQTMVPNVWVW